MKNKLFWLLLWGAAHTTINAQAPARKILWIKGPAQTSNQWTGAITLAQNALYQFSNVNIWPYNTNTTANDVPAWADIFNITLEEGEYDNVLGIGHDAGGLILRYMAMNPNQNKLSAMILDGVPNKGGRIFTKLLPDGTQSEAQRMVSNLLDLRTQAQSCQACRMLEATQSWLNTFTHPEAAAYYDKLTPEGTTIANMAPVPDIPFAVIWGNENDDALTLTRLVGSWYNAGLVGQDAEYLECYRKELEQRLADAQDNFLIGYLQSVATYAGSISKFNATSPVSVGAVMEAQLNALAIALRAKSNLAKEVREMFECELIHQALNAKWNFMVSDYQYNVISQTVMLNCIPCDNCSEDPDQQVVGYCYSVCDWNCTDPNATVTQTAYYYQYDPHDGLLRYSEQTLDGAQKTYQVKQCNHFQEQFWEYTPVRDAFNDLFMGGAGAAFVVPKS